MDDETRWMDATELAGLIADGEAKPLELLEAAIERVEAHNGPLNAVNLKWYEHAREVAAGPLPAGPFKGVPFLLKDLHAHYKGQTVTQGNVAVAAAAPISEANTNLVDKFNESGLVTFGRTTSPELGSVPVTEPVAHGPTRNPWNPGHTPGGSSGGAAAAVASGMIPMAHASDGGGSIRIPASCCGLVGLKPSQGRISMGPGRAESNLGVEFCVSRTVRDTALLLDAVQGPGVGDDVIAPAPDRPYVDDLGIDPGKLRIGMLDSHPLGGVLHTDCIDAAQGAGTLLEGLGHHVERAHPKALEDDSFSARFMAMWATTMAVGVEAMGNSIGRPLTEEEVEPVNWAQAQFAAAVSGPEYALSLAAAQEFRRRVQQWWEDGWDLLLTPTLGEPPLKIGEIDPKPGDPMAGMRRSAEFVPFTPAFNVSGQPAISLPLHWSDSGLPIGVQLVAAYGREDLLIQLASQLEQAQPWADRHPN